MGKKKAWTRFLVSTLVILIAAPAITQKELEKPESLDKFNCVLCLAGHHPAGMSLSAGFNYELIRLYGKHLAARPSVFSSASPDSVIKYILRDSVRIAVLPYSDSLASSERLVCSEVLPDSTVWVTDTNNELLVRSFDKWMKTFSGTESYRRLKARFALSYEPYGRVASGKEFDAAGPYDDIVRRCAAQIGWDWRLLDALIWQESKFRIDAVNPSGAEGLLQMLPSTARRFGNDDMLDPERNIETGTAYIARIEAILKDYCDSDELVKFTLAAYVAGEGRVLDCIRYARGKGMAHATWNDLVNVMDTLRLDSDPGKDSLLVYGGIRGMETRGYVDAVYSLYDAFKIISPARSSQDPPAKHTATE